MTEPRKKTVAIPDVIGEKIIGPVFAFVGHDDHPPRMLLVGKDEHGNPVYAPVGQPSDPRWTIWR